MENVLSRNGAQNPPTIESYDDIADLIEFAIDHDRLDLLNLDLESIIHKIDPRISADRLVYALSNTVAIHSEFDTTLLENLISLCRIIYNHLEDNVNRPKPYTMMICLLLCDNVDKFLSIPVEEKLATIQVIEEYLIDPNLQVSDFVSDEINEIKIEIFNSVLEGKSYIYDTRNSSFDESLEIVNYGRVLESTIKSMREKTMRRDFLNKIATRAWLVHVEQVQDELVSAVMQFIDKSEIQRGEAISIVLDCLYAYKDLNDSIADYKAFNINIPAYGKFIVSMMAIFDTMSNFFKASTPHLAIARMILSRFGEVFRSNNLLPKYTEDFFTRVKVLRDPSRVVFDESRVSDIIPAIRLYYIEEEKTNFEYTVFTSSIDVELDRLVNRVPFTIVTEATKSKSNRSEDYETDTDEDDDIIMSDDDENEKNNEIDDRDNETNDQTSSKKSTPKIKISASQSNKGYSKFSKKQADGQRKIYNAYKKYKNAEDKVDSQLSKMLSAAKRAFIGQTTEEEIIEGKKFTPIGLLKRVLRTAAVFSFGKVSGFIYLVVSHALNKKRTDAKRREILAQIEEEIAMLDEKIADATADGNRKAKYALMRTRSELNRAKNKIKYHLTATQNDIRRAKSFIRGTHYQKSRPAAHDYSD